MQSPPSKRGLSWPTTNTDPLFPFTKPGSRISWFYNWSPSPLSSSSSSSSVALSSSSSSSSPSPSTAPAARPAALHGPSTPSLAFVPMAWNHVHLPQLLRSPALPAAQAVLAFNEPELASQANMSVEQAVEAWMEVLAPLREGGGPDGRRIRVGSPAIASTEAGVAWLLAFVRGIRARGSDVDFWCLHWYGETLGQFYDYIWSTYHRLGPDRPCWITEFACTNWSIDRPMPKEQVEEFARESVKYLDSLDWVERYCWFGAMRDTGTVGKWARMIDDDGKLTALGKQYRDD